MQKYEDTVGKTESVCGLAGWAPSLASGDTAYGGGLCALFYLKGRKRISDS